MVTNRVDLTGLLPSMMLLARASWAASVWVSRRARLPEYCHTARHALECSVGSQTGSARSLMLLTRLRECRGVTVSMICPSLKTSPFQWKWDSRSLGALVMREPTMNDNPRPIHLFEIVGRENARVGGDDHRRLLDIVAGAEGLDDRQYRVSLNLGAVETADLQRESEAIDPQSDHDLRIHATFLGKSDPA